MGFGYFLKSLIRSCTENISDNGSHKTLLCCPWPHWAALAATPYRGPPAGSYGVKTDLTVSPASPKGRTRMRWWLFPFRSQHPAELYLYQRRAGTSDCPFVAGHETEVCCTRLCVCAGPAGTMSPVQYQPARDRDHARARVYPLLGKLEIHAFTGLLVEQSSI